MDIIFLTNKQFYHKSIQLKNKENSENKPIQNFTEKND